LSSDGVIFPDTSNSYCYIEFFDTAISDDSNIIRETLRLAKDIVEVLDVFMEVLIARRKRRVKSYPTREIMNYS